MEEFPNQTIIELAFATLFRKVIWAIIGGLAGLFLGITFSPILKLIYNYDWTTLGHEQPSYVIVSGCLGMLLGLLPNSISKLVRYIRNVRAIWAIVIVVLSLAIYFIIVHLVVRHLILDAA